MKNTFIEDYFRIRENLSPEVLHMHDLLIDINFNNPVEVEKFRHSMDNLSYSKGSRGYYPNVYYTKEADLYPLLSELNKAWNDKIITSDIVNQFLDEPLLSGVFDNATFNKKKMRMMKSSFLNVDAFVKLFNEVYTQELHDYIPLKTTKGMVRYVKPISSDFEFLIEYNAKWNKDGFYYEGIMFPVAYLYLLDKKNDKQYILGSLGIEHLSTHPLSYGIMPIRNFISYLIVIETAPNHFNILDTVHIEEGLDHTTLIPKPEFSIAIKKQMSSFIDFNRPFRRSLINNYEAIGLKLIEANQFDHLYCIKTNKKSWA